MKARNKILALLTAAMLAAPVSMAQQNQGASRVQNFPSYTGGNVVSTYVTPLNDNNCVAAEPASMLKSPATILTELRNGSNVPRELASSIRVVESSTLNAATNGREIIITSALLNKLDTNAERAFVIGHELGHIVLDHVSKTQVRRVGLSLLDQFLIRRYVSEGTLTNLAAQLGLGLIDTKYSRGYEYQADEAGMKLLVNAGYPACAALNVFETLQASTTPSRTPEFLRSHPLTESRVRALVEKYETSTGMRLNR